jgi:TPR repeat protein
MDVQLRNGTPALELLADGGTIALEVFMWSCLLVACLLAVSVTAQAADFEAGKRAYDRGDYAAALREWQPLAEKGDLQAERRLGDLYGEGKGVPRDDAEALRWYRAAASRGDLKARFEVLLICFWKSFGNSLGSRLHPEFEAPCRGLDRSDFKRLSTGLYRQALDGDAEAQYMTGTALWWSRDRSSRALAQNDPGDAGREGLKWLIASVKQGYQRAIKDMLLMCTLDDAPTTECRTVSALLDERAADLQPNERVMLALYLLETADPKTTRAVELLVSVAEAGDQGAQHMLGDYLYEGSRVPRDYGKAAHWYRRYIGSTSQMRPLDLEDFVAVRRASERLGYMYATGAGVPADDREATRGFQRAAEMGSAYAQRSLADRYASGQGVPKDLKSAMGWFRRAADQGDVESQYRLGLALYLGTGVPQDYVQAHMWLNLAAASGDFKAHGLRDAVATHMSPEQIGQAQDLATKWHPEADPADVAAPHTVK